MDIIDAPYLSGVPGELPGQLEGYEAVLFADICKEGQVRVRMRVRVTATRPVLRSDICADGHVYADHLTMHADVPADDRAALQAPLAQTCVQLQSMGALPPRWRLASAPKTYNPLGCFVSFLNVSDVVRECRELL